MKEHDDGAAPRAGLGRPVALLAAVVLSGCGTTTIEAAPADLPPLRSEPIVLRSEVAATPYLPAALIEPDGLGPSGEVVLNASSLPQLAATTVGHATAAVIRAYAAPDAGAEVVATFSNPDEWNSQPVFQVVGPEVDGWVEVRLPIRPNGSTGWVRVDTLELTTNPYRIEVDRADFTLTLFRGEKVVLTTTIGIGTGETPTPTGEFYLTMLLRPSDPTGLYGPYAYGLSGYSDTLSSFNGGSGGIGIHGTNEPELLGTNVSHGCIRVHNTVISHLTTFLPLGTPVTIL